MKIKNKWFQLAVIAFACLGFQGSIIQVAGLGGRLVSQMGLSAAQIGQLASVSSLCGAILALFLGIAADRFNLVHVNTISMVVGAAGAVGRIFAGSFFVLFICNFLIGIGLTALMSNGIKFLLLWFEQGKAGTAIGTMIFGSAIGGTLGTLTVSLFPTLESAFTGSALVTILSLLVWVAFARVPEGVTSTSESFPIAEVKHVLKDRYLWILIFGMVFFFGGNYAINSFYVTALQVSKNTSEVTATLYSSIFQIAGFTSCLVLPILFDKVGRFRPFYIFLGVVAGIAAIAGWYVTGSATCMCFVVVALGIGGGGAIVKTVPGLMPTVKKEFLGTVNGILNIVSNLSMYLFPSYIISGIAGGDFDKMMIYCGISLVISGIVLCLLPEYGLKAKKQ